ncbi:MAG: ketohydroxyglutarate aldolase [Turicibacter sp.]|nr:ketohydroxyglutarate aldolase [Turicibacter sp.]
MYKAEITQRIKNTGVMAIVRVNNNKRGDEIAQGCLDGGVDVLEISYTLPTAGKTIEHLSEKFGDQLLVGAGTVLDSETARLAILSGAKFIIAPTFNKEVAILCNRYQVPYMPGCTTVTEMVEAMEYGAAFIKLFPIANFFGPEIAKVIKTPIPNMPILTSGGVTVENAKQWIKNGADCLGVGTLLTKGTVEEISENASKLRAAIVEAREQLK